MTFIDLVMDNGELTRISVPDKYSDECWDAVENAMKTRGWFTPARWEGCTATYLGLRLDRINMGRMIATL